MNATHPVNEGAGRGTVVMAVALTVAIVGIIGYQFHRLQAAGPLPAADRKDASRPGQAAGTAPRMANIMARVPEDVALDLDGQVEPTEEQLLRESIADYLSRMRHISGPGDVDRILQFPRMKAELEDLLRSMPPHAVPIIADLLNAEPDFVLRRILLYGLAAIGTDDAARVLSDFLLARIHDESLGSEHKHVVRALGMTAAGAAYDALFDLLAGSRAGEEAIARYRTDYVEALGAHVMAPSAVPLFVELLDSDPHFNVRNKAAQAVKNVAREDLGAARPALAGLMRVFERELHVPAEQRMGGEVKYVKQTSLGAIGQIGDPASIPFLLGVGTSDGDQGVRLSACAAISRVGGHEALPAMQEIFRNEQADGRRVFLQAMAQVPTDASVAFLRDVALESGSTAERREAVRGIRAVGGPTAEQALRDVLVVEKDAAVTQEAQQGLKVLAGGR